MAKTNIDYKVQVCGLLELSKLGFEYIDSKEKDALDIDPETGILRKVFQEKYKDLNPKKKDFEEVFAKVKEALQQDDDGKAFRALLVGNEPKLLDLGDLTAKSKGKTLNKFQVATNLSYENDGQKLEPAVTVFVNGLPLVLVMNGGNSLDVEKVKSQFKNKAFKVKTNLTQFVIATNNSNSYYFAPSYKGDSSYYDMYNIYPDALRDLSILVRDKFCPHEVIFGDLSKLFKYNIEHPLCSLSSEVYNLSKRLSENNNTSFADCLDLFKEKEQEVKSILEKCSSKLRGYIYQLYNTRRYNNLNAWKSNYNYEYLKALVPAEKYSGAELPELLINEEDFTEKLYRFAHDLSEYLSETGSLENLVFDYFYNRNNLNHEYRKSEIISAISGETSKYDLPFHEQLFCKVVDELNFLLKKCQDFLDFLNEFEQGEEKAKEYLALVEPEIKKLEEIASTLKKEDLVQNEQVQKYKDLYTRIEASINFGGSRIPFNEDPIKYYSDLLKEKFNAGKTYTPFLELYSSPKKKELGRKYKFNQKQLPILEDLGIEADDVNYNLYDINNCLGSGSSLCYLFSFICSRPRLIFMLKYGVSIVDSEVFYQKQMMKHYQIQACLKILELANLGYAGLLTPKQMKGIIQHLRNSGKTAVTYFSSLILKDFYASKGIDTALYYLVGRSDLVSQVAEEFSSRGFRVQIPQSKKELDQVFENPSVNTNSNEIVLVDICYFDDYESKQRKYSTDFSPTISSSLQRVLFVDEADYYTLIRYNGLAKSILESDPNSYNISLLSRKSIPYKELNIEEEKNFGDVIDEFKEEHGDLRLPIMFADLSAEAKARLVQAYKEDPKRKDKYLKQLAKEIRADFLEFRKSPQDLGVLDAPEDNSLRGLIILKDLDAYEMLSEFIELEEDNKSFDPEYKPLNILSIKKRFDTNSTYIYSNGQRINPNFAERFSLTNDSLLKFRKSNGIDLLIVGSGYGDIIPRDANIPALKRLYIVEEHVDDENDFRELTSESLSTVFLPYKSYKSGSVVHLGFIKDNYDKLLTTKEVTRIYSIKINFCGNRHYSYLGDTYDSDSFKSYSDIERDLRHYMDITPFDSFKDAEKFKQFVVNDCKHDKREKVLELLLLARYLHQSLGSFTRGGLGDDGDEVVSEKFDFNIIDDLISFVSDLINKRKAGATKATNEASSVPSHYAKDKVFSYFFNQAVKISAESKDSAALALAKLTKEVVIIASLKSELDDLVSINPALLTLSDKFSEKVRSLVVEAVKAKQAELAISDADLSDYEESITKALVESYLPDA